MQVKRVITIGTVFLLLLGVQLSGRTQNVQAEEPVYSDKTVWVPVEGGDEDEESIPTVPFKDQKAGPHCTWSLNKKGVARIKGTGKVTLNSDLFFAECDKIKKIVVSKGITIIGDGAFSGCVNVKKIVLPDTVHTLERYCFEHCEKLKTIKIPKKVKVVPYAAFQNDYALENVQFPKKLARIYGHAFDECRSLKKIVVSDNVKHMDKNAIVNCRSLKTVVLPKKLKKKELSFENCLALRKIKNRSSMSMKLDTVGGHRIWKVNGKKAKVLKAHQTAKTRGTKFKLSYKLQGGIVDGKLPSYHYYGEKVQFPRATRGKYEFIGWRWQKNITYGEEFVRWLKRDVTLTAHFVKVEVESLPGGTVRARLVDDGLSWRTYTAPDETWYVIRFRPVGGGKEMYPFFLQNGMEKTSTILMPGAEYIYDISYYIEVFDDGDAIKEWYLPKRIYVQP